MSQKEREQLHAEFSILNSLRHPNIVGYYHREHLKSTQELYLYMEYCGGGDLSKEIEKLKDANQYADEEYVWSIFSQLICALYRCHYGIDPPEVKSVVGPSQPPKPSGLKTKNQVMILHRDLKPENGRPFNDVVAQRFLLTEIVFLGVDNSVKLGDFGLSKLMQSHDFASTYVGTPFYMSPEICAAERYTLQSDIWSLGCVMYELCARTPPFNAKTHFHLIQKIKEGRLEPLPAVYSQDLQNVIKSCLNVNPLKRPDTAGLLNIPAVRLTRQQREVVELGKILKGQQEQLKEQLKMKTYEAQRKVMSFENDRQQMKAELEASLRREWEVKAGLEISRQVQNEKEKLHSIFESEVQRRVKTEVEKALQAHNVIMHESAPSPTTAQSSVNTNAETDFPSSTDLSSLSVGSPPVEKSKTPPPRRLARGPLARARTQFDSPMDVRMADPSPMSIDCLSLSPRRTDITTATNVPSGKDIFAAASSKKTRIQPQSSSSGSSIITEDDEDVVPDLPSPTRPPLGLPDPFKGAGRPGLLRQKTAPMNRLAAQPQPTLFPPTAAERPSRVPSPPSPKHSGFSPVRKAPPKPATSGTENDMFKAVMQRNFLGQNGGGRTLVELAQARAGAPSQVPKMEKGDSGERKENLTGSGEAPTWDPERDDMPSPFLIRGGKGLRRL